MKILNYWVVVLTALTFSSAFVSCSENDDTDNTGAAKAIAGTYQGYSIGKSKLFSDYLMGDQASATITANEDGTINLVYKSGAGDFTLNNIPLSAQSFSGEGEVGLMMGNGNATKYEYSLKGSIDHSKVLTLKANLPVPMGGLDVEFIQGETPITYYIAATYQYNSNLALSVNGNDQGSTTECKAIIKRKADKTVDVTINGFSKIAIEHMSLGDFTISGVHVTAGENGSYSLSSGEFETEAGATSITGKSLNGTIAADGTANMVVVFNPGSMPIPITANFTGSNTQSNAQ